MLRDITIGQYFPGDSIIHRLDPRFKIITRNDGWVAKDFILIDRHDRPPGRTAFQSVTSPEFVILFAKDALL